MNYLQITSLNKTCHTFNSPLVTERVSTSSVNLNPLFRVNVQTNDTAGIYESSFSELWLNIPQLSPVLNELFSSLPSGTLLVRSIILFDGAKMEYVHSLFTCIIVSLVINNFTLVIYEFGHMEQ